MKILIVDDNPTARDTLIRNLKQLTNAFEFVEVGSGEEALDIIKKGFAGVVILDNGLPGLQGVDTLREIHKFDPEIKVIIASGFLTANDAAKAAVNGALKVVPKPINCELIYNLIKV